MFKVADRIISIDSYQDFLKIDLQLAKTKTVLIPHASLIAYLGEDKVEQLKMKYFGNKLILRHESDRNLERSWLKKTGIKLPKFFKTPAEIDRPTIVKFHGAQGGRNYFLTSSARDFAKKIKPFKGQAYYLQEYIIGAPIYAHYFYSPLTKELEIFGFDKRYESNVDAIGRISAQDQLDLKSLQTSYTICGNIPMVIRESFLPLIIDYGQAVVDVSKKIVPPGLFGPFCLEMIIAPGGFSYGDETGSGQAMANRIKNHLLEQVTEFVAQDKLVLGICNGFQVLVNLGLLPDNHMNGFQDKIALTHNDSALYTVRWVDLKVNNHSPWLKGLTNISLPVAHGEGKFVASTDVLTQLKENHQVALSYTQGEMCQYQNLAPNPNGSLDNVAGITDPSGRILGLMPHPERAVFFTHLPNWQKKRRSSKELVWLCLNMDRV